MRPTALTALATGTVTVAASLVLTPAMAAETRSATSELAHLVIDAIDSQGVAAFEGSYGTADTPDLSLDSDADDGDFSDPDGVLDYVTVNGTQIAATSWDKASGQLTARANATGFELDYNEVDDFLTSGSVDSYAQCLDGGGALAYARGDGSVAHVLGTEVPAETPTTIEVTGGDLNMPGVATGTLTVLVHRVETVVNEPTQVSAEAYVDITVSGDLKDADGNTVHQGEMISMQVGHVKVTCKPAVDPTSSSSSATPTDNTTSPDQPTSDTPTTTSTPPTTSPAPTSDVPTSDSPTPTSQLPTSQSESPSDQTSGPTDSPTSAAPSSTATTHANGGFPSGGNTGSGGGLPITGTRMLPVLTVGLAAVLFGVVLLIAAKRRSG